MAKEEKKTVAAPEAAVAEVKPSAPKLPSLPVKFKFICEMCELFHTGKNVGNTCSLIKLTGKFCDNVQKLVDEFTIVNAENDKHRKYIKAFNSKPYYTEEEILQLYNATYNSGDFVSPDEFTAYCRAMGMKVV